jgi:gliding motility-associated-like protein
VKNTLAKIKTMRAWVFALAITCCLGAYAQSPEQNCFSAIPVCQPFYTQNNSYIGSGTVQNEITPALSCLGAGELNAVWYIITVQADGNLQFTITPLNGTDDYDWAVFNLTNAACTDIATVDSLQVSCDFSGSTFPNASTGPNGGINPQDEPVIPVLAGETYVVCVSNFSSTQSGYNLDFANSPIIDTNPPGVIGVTQPIACGATQLTFTFDENVLCNSAQLSDFQLTGPGGPYTLSNLLGAACAAGGSFEDEFTFTVSPPLTVGGDYSLDLVGPVTDNCGNAAPFPTPFPFQINSVTGVMQITDEFCGQNNGSASVVANGGTPPYTYLWTDNSTGTSINNLDVGNYSVTITDDGGCQSIVPFTIADPLSFTITVNQYNDTCGFGLGGARAFVNGGTGPFVYSWNPPLAPSDTVAGVTPGTYTLTVSDAGNPGCQQQSVIFIQNINDVRADFYAEPSVMSYLDPTTTFKNTSINANTYIWDFGDDFFSFDENPPHTYPPTPGIYNVTLIATSNRGCSDTIMRTVRIDYELNFYVPSAFTPNGDQVNEEFMVYSDGINYSDFQMYIFDRWGHQVFATSNPYEKWNGAYFNDGDILADGIYVYHVNFTQLYDVTKHTYVGKVALIK